MFSYVRLDQRVPQDHPLRAIRRLTDVVLRSLRAALDEMDSASGRPSIVPEYVLRAQLLLIFGWCARNVAQPVDVVPLQTAVQRGSGPVWDRGLERVEVVIERQQRVPAKGNRQQLPVEGKGRSILVPAQFSDP